MRGLVVFLGLLLMLGGGAVAGAQYAPLDLSTIPQLDQLPGSREFLKTPMALYAGGGAAGLGFLLIIIALATGGKKKKPERAVVKSPSLARETIRPPAPKPAEAPRPAQQPARPAPAPPPVSPAMMAPATKAPPPIEPPAPMPKPAAPPVAAPAPQAATPKPAAPVAAAPPAAPPPHPVMSPAPVAPASAPAAPSAKPQASAQPPASVAGAPPPDPRALNRKRIQDLVTINDALKAYRARNNAFPKADGLAGANERGRGWIPGLSPDFLPELPLDPMQGGSTQYVYVSDGANYKLLAQGVSLVGSMNVEVLGIKIDQTRNPTQQNAAFGFWTPQFAGA